MKGYKVTIHFSGPEDCAWFARQAQRCKERVANGSQLEGGSRGIMMAALGRAEQVECTMSDEQIHTQITGAPTHDTP